MKDSILAKSKKEAKDIKIETLVEHTQGLVDIINTISTRISFQNIDYKIHAKFFDLLKLVCLLHDLGKMNSKFQQKIKIANEIDEVHENKEVEKENELWKEYKKIDDQRHNILTGAFLKSIFEQLEINEDIKNVLYKSILLHHGSYEKYMEILNIKIEDAVLNDIEEDVFLSDQYNIEEIEEYINNNLNIEISFNENFLDYDFMHQLNEDFRGNIEIQYLYIILKGFLNLADHLASTQIKNFNYFLTLNKEEIDNKLLEQIKNKIESKNVKFRPMQERLRECMGKNVLTEAFTGSGKTAADYRWWSKRKVFLVPNKISAESFYKDAEEILGEENIGLLHGDISLYVEDKNSEENGEGIRITLRDKNLTRNFARPYIIATVDQILLSMFKYPGYEKVFASVYDSYITVDEVHLLHPRMFLILMYFIEFADEYLNTRFHLMTATLPQAYRDRLEKCNVKFVKSNENEEVEENRKIKLEIIKDNELVLKKIIAQALKEKNKVLIIRNTVDSAIKTFDFISKEFDESEINLLHSRFKFNDKKQKYIDILNQEGDIWISTQSVEISLDLDFQVIISDNAPMESIIQRMGRNNRHDTLEYGFFYITDNCDKDVYEEKVKKVTLKLLKEDNKKVLSMKDRKEILQKYYKDKDIINYYEAEFKNAETEIRNIYGLKSGELSGKDIIFNYEPYLNIVDNKLEASKLFRNTGINAKVILEKDHDILKSDNNGFKKYQENSIQISEGYYRTLQKAKGLDIKDGYLVIREGFYKYSCEKGLELDYETIKKNKSFNEENQFI